MFIRNDPAGWHRWLPLAAMICLLPAAGLLADTEASKDTSKDKVVKDVPKAIMDEIVPLNTFDFEFAYVGQSPFKIKRFDGDGPSTQQPFRSISETNLSVEYGHRFHLFGKVYLRLAGEYERFDFSTTTAPLPSSLQSLGGLVSVEYIQQGEIGAFFRASPGVYYSDINHLDGRNFNVPIALGAILPVGKKVYVLVGAEANILAKYPVFPIVGVVWLITDHVRLMGVPPDPKLVYSVNDNLDFFVGGEVLGQSFKRDANPDYRPQDQRFNNAIIDYSEFRAGGGLTYTPSKKLNLDIDVAGGWQFGSSFDYYRGNGSKTFKTEGAPYARVSLTAKF